MQWHLSHNFDNFVEKQPQDSLPLPIPKASKSITKVFVK
jgi:hypothetical protein